MKKQFLLAALVASVIMPASANAEHRHGEHCGHGWERPHHANYHHRRHHRDAWFYSTYISEPQPYYYTSYHEPMPVYVVQRRAPVYVAPQPVFSLGLFVR